MPEIQLLIFTVIGLALVFDFINGFHDTANAIATSVSTRALSPKQAIWMAAALNFLGALFSTGVAKTIGGDIVKSASLVDQQVITAALVGAIVWNLLTWWYGIPSSSSHALVGGIIGAVVAGRGWDPLNLAGVIGFVTDSRPDCRLFFSDSDDVVVSRLSAPCIKRRVCPGPDRYSGVDRFFARIQ